MADTIDREWITAEFLKAIADEEHFASEAKARIESPPDESLGTLYGEIAEADARHRTILETIATRYGHTPSRSVSGGIGEALGRIRERVSEIGTSPSERVEQDLEAKSRATYRYQVWIAVFETIGDAESARELAAILTEENSHIKALLQGLTRLVQNRVQPEHASSTSDPSATSSPSS